jgi:hypothetical protein
MRSAYRVVPRKAIVGSRTAAQAAAPVEAKGVFTSGGSLEAACQRYVRGDTKRAQESGGRLRLFAGRTSKGRIWSLGSAGTRPQGAYCAVVVGRPRAGSGTEACLMWPEQQRTATLEFALSFARNSMLAAGRAMRS